MIDSTGAYRYYTTDRLGSIRATTGPAGGVRDRGSYQPFGETLANGGGAVTNDGNPLAFAGQYLDPVTGLYDMRARNYDPSVGRFTSLDPLGYRDAPQASTYGYARNNPLSFRDPGGMGAIGDHCAGILGFLTCDVPQTLKCAYHHPTHFATSASAYALAGVELYVTWRIGGNIGAIPEPENMGGIMQVANPLLVHHAESIAKVTGGSFAAGLLYVGYYESSQLEQECS
jgi:RHS repeat-associated protein